MSVIKVTKLDKLYQKDQFKVSNQTLTLLNH